MVAQVVEPARADGQDLTSAVQSLEDDGERCLEFRRQGAHGPFRFGVPVVLNQEEHDLVRGDGRVADDVGTVEMEIDQVEQAVDLVLGTRPHSNGTPAVVDAPDDGVVDGVPPVGPRVDRRDALDSVQQLSDVWFCGHATPRCVSVLGRTDLPCRRQEVRRGCDRRLSDPGWTHVLQRPLAGLEGRRPVRALLPQ